MPKCKLGCGAEAMEGIRFADMCFDHYLEHNRACAMMN